LRGGEGLPTFTAENGVRPGCAMRYRRDHPYTRALADPHQVVRSGRPSGERERVNIVVREKLTRSFGFGRMEFDVYVVRRCAYSVLRDKRLVRVKYSNAKSILYTVGGGYGVRLLVSYRRNGRYENYQTNKISKREKRE